MIRAHPWLGIGPEQVKYQFDQWMPAIRAAVTGRLLRALAQCLSAVRGRARNADAAHFSVDDRENPVGLRAGSAAKTGEPEARFVLHGAIAVILAILAEGFAEYNLGDSEVLTMFLARGGVRLHRVMSESFHFFEIKSLAKPSTDG
jgi:putative inorganic carbon (HCO3(-)) transporter